MRINNEESFGPITSVVVAENAEDALRIANDTEYGLSGAIFSRDINKAMRLAERLETGICHIKQVNGTRRASDALWRSEGQWLRAIRRQSRNRRVQRIALDDAAANAYAVPALKPTSIFGEVRRRFRKEKATKGA